MGFYEEISKYYDFIFPVGEAQIKFIEKAAGEPPRSLLDIACGSGGYSIEFAKRGYEVTAVDLDAQMVNELNRKVSEKDLKINALQGNMLELGKILDSKYDLAFCIGNSLVHLDGDEEIGMFLKQARNLILESGSLVIQIINYDRVLENNVRSLPTIENREIGLKFQRIYGYDSDRNRILFKTILEADGRKLENEIELYPLLSRTLVELLRNSGFNDIKLYGDFKGNEFDKSSSYSLVVVAS